jgi:ATP-dependent DNA ligase
VFFFFDLLHLDGEDLCAPPLIERKAKRAALLSDACMAARFMIEACAMALEGIVSKRADAAYAPGNRGLWVKVKCLHLALGERERDATAVKRWLLAELERERAEAAIAPVRLAA